MVLNTQAPQTRPIVSHWKLMFRFAVSIFLSAFLLFQIQPIIGKIILPWFGGTPAVWSTAMLFFQLLLMGGYVYAHWLIGHIRIHTQPIIHIALIALAILLFVSFSFVWTSPITPDPSWKPQNVNSPLLDIFRLLIVSIGLPYFILASNGSLMQAWYSRSFPEQAYTRLYALSNLGSLLGLITYPILMEPFLALRSQGWTWSISFSLFGLLASWIAIRSGRAAIPASTSYTLGSRATREESAVDVRPSFPLMLLWMILSATASLFLLSVTNQMTQEVAAIPFLWVLPLALYLLSFILTFSGERGYHRIFFALLFILSAALTLFVMLNATSLHIFWQILAYCLLLFAACMLCHGELYLLRPSAAYLTTFYLLISIGGVLGGIFVNLIAPLIFSGYWEFFVGIGMAIAILLSLRARWSSDAKRRIETRATQSQIKSNNLSARVRFVFTVFILITVMLALLDTYFSGTLYAKRNFYGVIRVREVIADGSTEKAYVMSHGITVHGLQFIDAESRQVPTTYYVRDAGAGLAILNHPQYGHDMRVGLLGLGVGTLAIYAQPGDEYRLYEINPVVMDLAKGQGNYFSFLRDSQANITTILGDARISLERELAEGNPQDFDVLVLDTFSSDSIPVHLVTKEAFALYLAHLASDGMIAAHITNLHLDLQPVFWQLAGYYDLSIVRVEYPGDSNGGYASHWILLSRDPALLEIPSIQEHAVNLTGYSTNIKLWTDDYSNLFQILK